MSVSLGANGSSYDYPETGELSWGSNATNFASAVSAALAKLGLGGTLTTDAVIDIASTTKGIRIPSMTTTQRNAISTPLTGFIVYNTTTNRINVYYSSAWHEITIAESIPDYALITNATNPYLQLSKTNATSRVAKMQLTGDLLNITHASNDVVNIDASGNVGIGTNAPSNQLTVYRTSSDTSFGAIRLDGNGSYAGVQFAASGTNKGSIGADSASLYITHESGILLSTGSSGNVGGTSRLKIDSTGNVGIGTTTPSYQLQLSTDSAAKPSTNVWTISSDERIKENITLADIDRCYEIVKNLPLKKYKWKYYSETESPDQNMLGWIAQDVQEYFPKAVNVTKFVTKKEVKENDIVLEQEESIDDCLNLNSDQINKVLYGAVQKLQTLVETQQAIIENLKSRIETLEAV